MHNNERGLIFDFLNGPQGEHVQRKQHGSQYGPLGDATSKIHQGEQKNFYLTSRIGTIYGLCPLGQHTVQVWINESSG